MERLAGLDGARLERSCIRLVRLAAGVGVADVRLTGVAFARHRHDTYAVGVTTSGVQTFRYRGARRVCLPGEVHVLLPDEARDGGPGRGLGFAYRIVYLDPAICAEASGGRLTLVTEPVHRLRGSMVRAAAFLRAGAFSDGELTAAELVAHAAELLSLLGGRPLRDPPSTYPRSSGRAATSWRRCGRGPARPSGRPSSSASRGSTGIRSDVNFAAPSGRVPTASAACAA